MWKIVNSTNSRVLGRLDRMLIRPMLRCLTGGARTGVVIRNSSPYAGLHRCQKVILDIALDKKVGGRPLEDVLNEFALGPDAARAGAVESLYFSQRTEIRRGRYGIPCISVPSLIARVFSVYLYDNLFDDVDIWSALGVSGFNRALFHENYRRDNGYPSACPYCDLDTIHGKGNYVVEHFLPRVRFPLLSLDAFNLFTSCNSCNLSAAGKGTRVVPAAGSPYFIQAGDHIDFCQDDGARSVSMKVRRSLPAVAGLVSLLNLDGRYAERSVYELLRGRQRAFEQAMNASIASDPHITPDMVTDYVRQFNSGAPAYFALRSWVVQRYLPGAFA